MYFGLSIQVDTVFFQKLGSCKGDCVFSCLAVKTEMPLTTASGLSQFPTSQPLGNSLDPFQVG